MNGNCGQKFFKYGRKWRVIWNNAVDLEAVPDDDWRVDPELQEDVLLKELDFNNDELYDPEDYYTSSDWHDEWLPENERPENEHSDNDAMHIVEDGDAV